MGEGMQLEKVASSHKLHPNTVRKWCKRLHIFVGLMRTKDSAQPKQALRFSDVEKFLVLYRQQGGRV